MRARTAWFLTSRILKQPNLVSRPPILHVCAVLHLNITCLKCLKRGEWELQRPYNIFVAPCLSTILLRVHHGFKTQLLILLRGIYSERVCSWIKMSGLTVQWLRMSSLQCKCIKLVWRTQSTRSHCYREMKDLWHPWERWPYWFTLQIQADGWKVDIFHVSSPNSISSYQSSCKSVNPLY